VAYERPNGIGSLRVIDQVKAYKPGHLLTADEVRAMAGVLSLDQNVSKGYVTTTSDFAPRLRDEPDLKRVIPYRLELKAKRELLAWLDEVTGRSSQSNK
jgi:restriction system protein